jgi:ADP-ribosylglycohydrolase
MAAAEAAAAGPPAGRGAAAGRGRWGACTQMAMCVGMALRERGAVHLPTVAEHLRRWAERRDFRHASPALRRFLVRLRRGGPWDACAVSDWRGTGFEILLSAVPVALFLHADAPARRRAARAVVRLGRRGAGAADAAAAAADVLAWALAAPPDAPPPLQDLLAGARRRGLRRGLRRLEAAARQPTSAAAARPRPARVVAAALEASGFGARDLGAALEQLRAWGGDPRQAAALAGAVIGARRGEAALPSGWVRSLDRRQEIARLAEALGGAAARPGIRVLVEEVAAGLAARLWRWTRITVGACLALLGLVGLFLPFLQGFLFLFMGLAILGAEFPWARDLLRRTRATLKRGWRRWRAGATHAALPPAP